MIKLTNDQLGQLKRLHAMRDIDGEEVEQLLSKVIERGLYDINYRMERNKKKWAIEKANKELMKKHGVKTITELITKLS
jgi:hypothetical protein